jgi:hypothetical protein
MVPFPKNPKRGYRLEGVYGYLEGVYGGCRGVEGKKVV